MATTTNFGWETPDDTDLVKDGALAMRTLGNSIDTSMADLKGGTTGQILSKNSNTDMDFVWITNDVGDITAVTAGTGLTGGGTSGAVTVSLDSPVAATLGGTAQTSYATGDLLYASGTNTLAKRTIGTTGQILTVSGGVPTWATPAASTSGLNLITRQTVTNAADTGASFAGVFTSTYDTYLVIIEGMSAVTQNVTMQLKYSTNTNHTSDYYGNSAYALYNASSFSFINTNNASAFNILGASSVDTRATIWINGVGNASERATWSGNGFEGNNNRIYNFAGEVVTSNTWTGLNFLMASGNITITAAVYGLAK